MRKPGLIMILSFLLLAPIFGAVSSEPLKVSYSFTVNDDISLSFLTPAEDGTLVGTSQIPLEVDTATFKAGNSSTLYLHYDATVWEKNGYDIYLSLKDGAPLVSTTDGVPDIGWKVTSTPRGGGTPVPVDSSGTAEASKVVFSVGKNNSSGELELKIETLEALPYGARGYYQGYIVASVMPR